MSLIEFIFRKAGKVFNFTKTDSTSQYLQEFGKSSQHIFPVHLQQTTCILRDESAFFIRHKSFQFVFIFDGCTERSLLSACLIIFLQDHLLFPIVRANTNYIFLNWGCMIYSCLLSSRISMGEISYLSVSSIELTIQYSSCSFPH